MSYLKTRVFAFISPGFLLQSALAAVFLFSGLGSRCVSMLDSPSATTTNASGVYYLDCSLRHNGNGTEKSPWTSPTAANAWEFHPGDRLLIKRGTVCHGTLAPRGSGNAQAPIVVEAYGSGQKPVIKAGNREEAVKLFNQQYWEVKNLDIAGGRLYGIYVSGDTPHSTLSHIYLDDLDVHGATYKSTKRADSGEVFISPNGVAEVIKDVVVDHVVAHDSHVSEGIFVSAGGAWIENAQISQPLGSDIIVRDSAAHDVDGDGILIAELTNGLLQGNVVYRSGLCRKCTGSTPVGIWEWYCHRCTVQFNESYANDSWDGDGGDFDIDYFNDDNVVQYNYGHDSAGYCVAVFGAGARASHNNIFRFNVCSNNGRKSKLSKQGEVYIHTWDQGSLDGVEIYNNVFFWNPAAGAAALNASDAQFSGNAPRFFRNNIIYASVPYLIQTTTSALSFDANIYWTTSGAPQFKVDDVEYSGLSTYQVSSKQDIHSYYIDPLLTDPRYHAVGRPTAAFRLLPGSPAINKGVDVCGGTSDCSMGARDFWGQPLPRDGPYSIGADQRP